MLVANYSYLPLLVRDFYVTLAERDLCARRKPCQLLYLVTIAEESLNIFIQRKSNKAMALDLMAIRQDK